MARKMVVLLYKHVGKELSDGAITLTEGDRASFLLEFKDFSYIQMMKSFAQILQQVPDAEAAIQRIDRPGLQPVVLPPDEVELFRTDPAAAIRQRCFPPQVIHIHREKTVTPAEVPVLSAGYEVLAEAFGNRVYTRAKDGEVECVACGEWSPVKDGAYTCHDDCRVTIPLEDYRPNSGWACIATEALLASDRDLFFLPRRWNKNGNWISRADLETLYNKYMQEKSV